MANVSEIKYRRLNIPNITPEFYAAIKLKSKARKKTMSAFIREAIKSHLKT